LSLYEYGINDKDENPEKNGMCNFRFHDFYPFSAER